VSTRSLLTFAVLIVLGSTALGCGGASSQQTGSGVTTSASPVRTSVKQVAFLANEPVATVGRVTITRGALRHWVAVGTREQLGAPEPPGYAGCIQYLRSPGTSTTTEATERLKTACARQYEELAKPALSSLIHIYWILGEARSEGARVGGRVSGAELEPLASRLTHRIYEKLEREVPPVTSGQVAGYYLRHKKSFVVPERRDLNILRYRSGTAAERAKEELEHGASFATVVKKTTLEQPPSSRNGFLRDLGPHQFGEPPLSRAVFSAPLNALRGPVEISLGFYVFEVIHRTPPHQKTLAEAKAEITTLLRQERRTLVFSHYASAFRDRWQRKTSCHVGYVVKYCKQYRQSEAESKESATTL
jgi:hypothetical protein